MVQGGLESRAGAGCVTLHDMVRGTVKAWDSTAGRGVLSSPELPGDVIADAEAVRGRARDLVAGAPVLFDYEPLPAQDEVFRAVWIKRG
jgi:cold shock CspA family protein